MSVWSDFDFEVEEYLSHPEQIDCRWYKFIESLPSVDYSIASSALGNLVEAASTSESMLLYLMDMGERTLYDLRSDTHNDDYFITFLEAVVALPELDAIYKIRPREQLRLMKLNRVGQVAVDFDYTLRSGERDSMHSIDSEYTILFFNNPDCYDCGVAKGEIKRSSILNRMVDEGDLSMLSIYPESDLELWRKGSYPKIMINSYDADQRVVLEGLYDLRTTPTIYLLDRDKRVILKNTTIAAIEMWLGKL